MDVWDLYTTPTQRRSHGGGGSIKGTECLPDSKKSAKNWGKIKKKEEKSWRKGKNREGSFTLPLLTDWAGYATAPTTTFLFPFSISIKQDSKLEFAWDKSVFSLYLTWSDINIYTNTTLFPIVSIRVFNGKTWKVIEIVWFLFQVSFGYPKTYTQFQALTQSLSLSIFFDKLLILSFNRLHFPLLAFWSAWNCSGVMQEHLWVISFILYIIIGLTCWNTIKSKWVKNHIIILR